MERHFVSSQYTVTDLGKREHIFLRVKVISRSSELGPLKTLCEHKDGRKKGIQDRLSIKKIMHRVLCVLILKALSVPARETAQVYQADTSVYVTVKSRITTGLT